MRARKRKQLTATEDGTPIPVLRGEWCHESRWLGEAAIWFAHTTASQCSCAAAVAVAACLSVPSYQAHKHEEQLQTAVDGACVALRSLGCGFGSAGKGKAVAWKGDVTWLAHVGGCLKDVVCSPEEDDSSAQCERFVSVPVSELCFYFFFLSLT